MRARTFDKTSCIRGHHVYKNVWTSTLGDELECRREGDNDFDRYAVAVARRGVVVGYLPQLPLTSTLWHCWTFLLIVDFLEEYSCSGQAVSFLSLYMYMTTFACGFVPYYGFNIDEFKFTLSNHQSFFSANIFSYTVYIF